MEVKRKRGSNSVTFVLGEKTFQRKAAAILNYKGSVIKYLTYKNKTARGSKPPKAVYVVIKAGYSYSTRRRYFKRIGIELPQYFYTSRMSEPDFVVKPQAVKEFAADTILAYDENYTEVMDANPENYEDIDTPYNIRELTIKFIY